MEKLTFSVCHCLKGFLRKSRKPDLILSWYPENHDHVYSVLIVWNIIIILPLYPEISCLFCPSSLKYHNYFVLIPWIIMFILPFYTLNYHVYSVLIPWNIMIILSWYPEISWLFCPYTLKYHDHYYSVIIMIILMIMIIMILLNIMIMLSIKIMKFHKVVIVWNSKKVET